MRETRFMPVSVIAVLSLSLCVCVLVGRRRAAAPEGAQNNEQDGDDDDDDYRRHITLSLSFFSPFPPSLSVSKPASQPAGRQSTQ